VRSVRSTPAHQSAALSASTLGSDLIEEVNRLGGLIAPSGEVRVAVPSLFLVGEAAAKLRVSEPYLRAKLRDKTFAGVKMAGRWMMTADQITAAITAMSTRAREVEAVSPSGLAKNSRLRRRVQRTGASV
jgi:hypothetical protein